MIKIPNDTKQFKQVPDSDVLGNIWSSFNLDLTENIGKIRVSGRGMIVDSSDDLAGLTTVPLAFQYYSNQIWCIAGGRMFYNSGDPDDSFTQDATSNTPTSLSTNGDMQVFNGAIYVVGNGELTKYNGSWTVVSTAPNSGFATSCIYGGRMYWSQNTYQIASVDTSDVLVEPTSSPNTNLYTLRLDKFGNGDTGANTISCIRASSNRIWIATINSSTQDKNGTRYGNIFEWDGVSTQPNKVYRLESVGALSLIIKDDIPYAFDANGRLLKFNGRAFVEVAKLPIDTVKYFHNPCGTEPQRLIHPNGMDIRNGRILLLINNVLEDSGDTIPENVPSGIWEYDENIGLYHKYSLSLWDEATSSTRTDFAQNRLKEVGALCYYKTIDDSSVTDGDWLAGATYYTTATVEKVGIFCNNSLRENRSKMGYLVTTKIESQYITDTWQKIYVKYKKLLDSSDKIVIKYRTYDVEPIEGTITWTSTTTLTTTLGLGTIAVGDEFEGTVGTGSGQIERITAISESSGTYTVTLENAVTGASGTAKGRFQKWNYMGTIQNQNTQYESFSFPSNVDTTWMQIKLIMYFTGNDEVEQLILINKPSITT